MDDAKVAAAGFGFGESRVEHRAELAAVLGFKDDLLAVLVLDPGDRGLSGPEDACAFFGIGAVERFAKDLGSLNCVLELSVNYHYRRQDKIWRITQAFA